MLSKIILSIGIALLLSGCATYHLTTQSLLEQCAESKKEDKVTILVAFPYIFFPGIVEGNNLRQLRVHDEGEKEYRLPVTNHLGIRITQNDKTRTTFYFNTLMIKDSTITGSKTHFFTARIKPIKLENIRKIEIQE